MTSNYSNDLKYMTRLSIRLWTYYCNIFPRYIYTTFINLNSNPCDYKYANEYLSPPNLSFSLRMPKNDWQDVETVENYRITYVLIYLSRLKRWTNTNIWDFLAYSFSFWKVSFSKTKLFCFLTCYIWHIRLQLQE